MKLPDGFVLDQQPATLPAGFVLDEPQQPQTSNVAAKDDRERSLAETAVDVAQATGTGLRAGVEALVGLPGEVQGLVEAAYEAGRSLVVDETPEDRAKRLAIAESVAAPGLPSTAAIQGVTNQIFGEPREPETTAGEFARTMGEFAPAVAAGPGSLARKAATVAAAGGASEAAGQATEGTAAEPFARVAGAVAGGVLSASKLNTAAQRVLKEAPDEETVKATTDALYDQIRAAGIQYNPKAYRSAVGRLVTDLRKKGHRPGTAEKSFSIVNELIDRIQHPMDFSDADSIRRAAGAIMRGTDPVEKEVAGKIIDAIDDFMLRAPTINTAGKSTKEIRRLISTARDFASRSIKQRQVADMIERAQTYQSGFESGLRNVFSSFLRSKKAKSFTAEERAAMREVAKGNFTNNALGTLGRFGLDLSQLGNRATLLPAGAAVVDPVIGGSLVAVGTVAKNAAQRGTRNAADRVSRTILAGRDAQRNLAAQRQTEQLQNRLRQLLLIDPTVQQATTTPPQ